MAALPSLQLTSLTCDLLPQAIALDQRALGGLWTEAGYQREIDSPNSDLLILRRDPPATPGTPQQPSSPEILGVGCLWAILEEAHITLLAVDPDYQRQGLGQTLLWGLLHCARSRGLEWATLEVRAGNRPALALYDKLGFCTVGERRHYYPDGENALILWHKGLQEPACGTLLDALYQQCCDRLGASYGAFAIIPSLTPDFASLS